MFYLCSHCFFCLRHFGIKLFSCISNNLASRGLILYHKSSNISDTQNIVVITLKEMAIYRKVPKFSDARELCCNLPKIQIKRPNLRVFCQKDATGIANSEDPDQTAPLGAV